MSKENLSQELETFIDEKRKELDERFTKWTTRVRTTLNSPEAPEQAVIDVLFYPKDLTDNCDCNV